MRFPRPALYDPPVDFRLLLDNLGAEHGSGVDDDSVRLAEQTLGRLPEDYRDFLRQVGWTTLRAQEVAGLGSDLPYRWLNVVDLTVQERLDGWLPEHLIAIHPDGGGNFACLHGNEVLLWYHDGASDVRFDSFTSWFASLLTPRLGRPDLPPVGRGKASGARSPRI